MQYMIPTTRTAEVERRALKPFLSCQEMPERAYSTVGKKCEQRNALARRQMRQRQHGTLSANVCLVSHTKVWAGLPLPGGAYTYERLQSPVQKVYFEVLASSTTLCQRAHTANDIDRSPVHRRDLAYQLCARNAKRDDTSRGRRCPPLQEHTV